MRIQLNLVFVIAAYALCNPSLYGQIYEGPYQSSANPYYWKNNPTSSDYWQQDVHYTIQAKLNDSADLIEGILILEYTNHSPHELRELFFHLYQNAFTEDSDLHQLRKTQKLKTQWGVRGKEGKGTTIQEFTIEGKESHTEIDGTILRVQFLNSSVLKPGETLTVRIAFTTYFELGGNIGRRMKRFEHNHVKHFNGVLWYPRICVYDAQAGWNTPQHLGKEFYGNFGSFDVKLTLPSDYIVEATGTLQNETEVLPDSLYEKIKISNYAPLKNTPPYQYSIPRQGNKTWHYKAVNVHDFAFTADPSYRIGRDTTSDGIVCIALAQEHNAPYWQPTSSFVKDVVELYSRNFGTYIYPKMVAADARDGMEYPMLTLNSGNWPTHRYVIAHEIGHNWFYGMLGSNETYRAFLDEGFTQFLTSFSLKKLSGLPSYPSALDRNILYNPYLLEAQNRTDPKLNTHSNDFSTFHNEPQYRQVYYKGATMLSNLEYVLGDSLFIEAMKHYVNQWKVKHPFPQDFRNAITHVAQTDLTWFFDSWLENTHYIDYALGRPKRNKEKTGYSIPIERKGSLTMPLDLTVYYTDRTHESFHIPNTYFVKSTQATLLPMWRGSGKLNTQYQAIISTTKKIDYVVIDTSQRLADVYRVNNVSRKSKQEMWYWDQGKSPQLDFNKSHIGVRPDLWWNAVDGLKLGINFKTEYARNKHVMDVAFWYNSGLWHGDLGSDNHSYRDLTTWFSYHLDYHHLLSRNWYVYYHSRINEGITMEHVGIEKRNESLTFGVGAKLFASFLDDHRFAFTTATRGDASYTHPFQNANSTLNAWMSKHFKHTQGESRITLRVRTPFLFTDAYYYGVYTEATTKQKLGKSELRGRFFAAALQSAPGEAVPLESQLFLAGANFEELLDHKFTRSRGFIPPNMFWGGTQPGHFQVGGGLNIRGYNGYIAPAFNPEGTDYEPLFAGNSGISGSIEWDFEKYLGIHNRSQSLQWLRIQLYGFSDAGVLTSRGLMELGEPGAYASPFRMNAGLGSLFTIKKWGNRDAINPFTLRFDFPFFLNRPHFGSDFVAFRWLVGIGQTF